MTGRRPVTRPRRLALVGLVAPGVLLLATACTGGSGGDSGSSTPASTSPSTSAGDSSTASSPSASDPATTGTAPTTTTTPGAPAPPSCSGLQVAVERVPGGGGFSYALVTVTNTGGSTCRVEGAPTLQLLDGGGAPLGSPSTTVGTASPVDLAAGAAASTLLEDASSTCSASSKSAQVAVSGPGVSGTVARELEVAPCSLQVKPYVAGTSPTPLNAG